MTLHHQVFLYIHLQGMRSDNQASDAHQPSLQQRTHIYFDALLSHLEFWRDYFNRHHLKLAGLNLGGDSASLYDREYQPLFRLLQPLLCQDTQVSLEVSPGDITVTRLKEWRHLGVHRLGVVVHTFNPKLLDAVGATWASQHILHALRSARNTFEQVGVDLTYGIPGQSLSDFEQCLSTALSYGVDQLSLSSYYQPLADSSSQGIDEHTNPSLPLPSLGEQLTPYYECARQKLKKSGFYHEELTHFSRTHTSVLYWLKGSYVAIGGDGHSFLDNNVAGFIDEVPEYGLRYALPATLLPLHQMPTTVNDYLKQAKAIIDMRDRESVFMEHLLIYLRTSSGVSLGYLQDVSQRSPQWSFFIREQIAQKLIICSSNRLTLDPSLWFDEYLYIDEILKSFGYQPCSSSDIDLHSST
ncbi:MAG: radical SAM protein [Proteobacteria bacterium]|nr:radical SAM protein [Pseudomonadota bacterium]